jgi:DUF1009 family protein
MIKQQTKINEIIFKGDIKQKWNISNIFINRYIIHEISNIYK